MGLLGRLFGRGRAEPTVAESLEALSQVDPKWSPETIRRRIRDAFFAVQQAWTLRDADIAAPYVTRRFLEIQRARVAGLVRAHRIHQLESPIVEDLALIAFEEGWETEPDPLLGPLPAEERELPRVEAVLAIRLVETLRDDRTQEVLAGGLGEELRSEQWSFVYEDGWRLRSVGVPGAVRQLKPPVVGDEVAKLTPESVLREKYARGEIEIEELERLMAESLRRGRVF